MKNRKIILFLLLFFLTVMVSCSNISYYWSVSTGQLDLLSRRISIEQAKDKYTLTAEEISKLQLVSDIKKFAIENLKLDIDEDIYSTYVHLEEPYVSYLLRVSSAYELKPYVWDFPFTGKVSYKGFFDQDQAMDEAAEFPKEEYDVYIRGVTAYSTLGWFEDPITSAMLSYTERDFVQVIFHELAHTLLFFKDHIDFNERFAEFIGRKASMLFYIDRQGEKSQTVQIMQSEWADQLLFSAFMVGEYDSLQTWYKQNKGNVTPELKEERLQEIQNRFLTEIKPNLKTNSYQYFSKIKLNNARLLSYRSYNYDMEEFEELYNSTEVAQDLSTFIKVCSEFKKSDDPEKSLKEKIANL